ncbi:protein-glutamate O-methyltransferase CheR [Terrimonas sp. NA20]|uniref:Protein-glutamate O-methyltransferase CheR n=1 Tax=Terrimonas ginsenosidimutans TaxID=2908004 RepID=A0ABS9L0E5_9BACT|nr:protein-glutamate O-methyltransferase CheR [Terrimonas ginsenosidimutans]MCG2617942.1 protein-glutamate O-methyltransferase CheR [Terrimonas ginsenosidimutans]
MELDNGAFRNLLKAVHSSYGYDFTGYAEASVKRRIIHYMGMHRINELADLQSLILRDENIFRDFLQELSVTVTEMFRDPGFYKSLREKVVERLATYPFIKVWVAGCATGEEVYSLAILFKEAGILDRSVIYATDINQQSLQIAKDGMYDASSMKAYTGNYQKSGGTGSFSQYYMSKYNSVMFDRSLKQNIVFSAHNLAMDKAFNEFQLILCRNVLIYFNQELQKRVLDLFHGSLCMFGYLGLGNKESLRFGAQQRSFEEVDRKERIYMKIK